ncbi:hypothetical protein [Agrobacterium tumefaciens]|uniref:hypothetical protein n=1 Tax=Agrobacterium tumefaciens TaxID=358 RepID=UPI0021D01E2C|nr:hypothetical protein [Agrobacterium tumefaciens]UXS23123.1 hypothetical protein FY153_01155 [Agrobacterium tumefaciens]
MTLKIEIDLHPDAGDLREQLVNHVAAIGFTPVSAPSSAPLTGSGPVSVGGVTAAGSQSGPGETAVAETQQPRERGKPAPGRARRTKEEIAEDEAADAAEAAASETGDGNDAAETEARSISRDPENRVSPEDTTEDDAQDAADEAAEVEETRKDETPLTRDDVKAAMTGYVNTYGLPATQEDGPKLIGSALGKPPKGEEYWKLSLIPDDQDALRKVVEAFKGALASNPYLRAKV